MFGAGSQEGGDIEVFSFDDGGFAFLEAAAGGGFKLERFLAHFGGGSFFGWRGGGDGSRRFVRKKPSRGRGSGRILFLFGGGG